jgi:3-methyladenine DNA glycosylase AlkD
VDAARSAAVTGHLVGGLVAAADPATRDHWTRYLKGQAVFRGVPMAGVRRIVRTMWREHGLAVWDVDETLALASAWLAAEPTEDKLAGVLLLAEHLAPRLETGHVDALASPLEHGHLADWNVVDWYATKAVHAFLTARPEELEARAGRVATWATAATLWQRRAGVVSFVKLAPAPPFDGFVPLVLDACAANLVSHDRFAHTGPGWVLRELSLAVPEAVGGFVAAHPELSAEGRRMATARLRTGTYRRR